MLTDSQIKKVKPPVGKTAPDKYSDGSNLYLLVFASGGKRWIMDYRFEGKRKAYSIGIYPDVTLPGVALEQLTLDQKGTAMEKAQIEGECFVGETLVWIKPWVSKFNGVRHDMSYIEDIEVGDEVLSRCEITGEMAYKKVTKVFAHRDAKVSVVGCNLGPEHYAKFGPKASTGILTTANHPFWVEGKGWTKVRDLQAGDEFLTHNGVKATFRIANLDAFEEDVYNFEVEDFHTYFVEGPGIWVHNKSPIDFKRMDTTAVADPKPQWTPLHKNEAELIEFKATLEQRKSELDQITTKTAEERQELKDVNRKLTSTKSALNELPARKTLDTSGIQTAALPEKETIKVSDGKLQNDLGRRDPDTKVLKGYPDNRLRLTSLRVCSCSRTNLTASALNSGLYL